MHQEVGPRGRQRRPGGGRAVAGGGAAACAGGSRAAADERWAASSGTRGVQRSRGRPELQRMAATIEERGGTRGAEVGELELGLGLGAGAG